MPRILAIDHGTVRIGLALSDELELVANPLRTLAASPQAIDEIVRIARDKHVASIVIGMPLHMSGQRGEAAVRVEAFASELGKALQHELPISFVDERLSSVTAERALKRSGQRVDLKDGTVDMLAAVVILQDHLNSQRGPAGFLLPEEAMGFEWESEQRGGKKR
jgi:putative holliday junction resolvase